MFTKNIKDTFTANLLSAVSGVLGEAKKKCGADCKCEACMKEGYMPTNDAPSDKDRKTAGKLGTLLKREREAKEKKEPNGVKESNDDVPFEGPYRKAGERKDEYGNKIKNVAKHLAKKAMKANEEVSLDEDQQYVELTNAHHGGKSYIPVHKSQAFAALNHYNSFSHNKGVRIIDKKQHDAIQAAKTPWNPSGESRSPFKEELEEAWVVKKGTEVVSSHKSKDEADVKAMKNPMYKVYAKEEAEIEEAVGDITVKKISPDEAFKKHTGQMTKKSSVPRDPKTGKTLYQKVTSEEVEELDELSNKTLSSYITKGSRNLTGHAITAGHEYEKGGEPKRQWRKIDNREKGIATAAKKLANEEAEDDGWYTHSQMYGSKKSEKHPKGISAAEWKSGIRWHHGQNKRINIKEEVEQIDEISREALASYTVNAAHDSKKHAVKAALKSQSGEDTSKEYRKLKNREKGIETAVSRLTQEEQDFIDALNDADIEQIDEISKGAALKYLSANKKDDAKARETGDYDRMTKRMRGTDMAVRKYTAKPGSKSVRVPATEEVELDEARGRPRKAGAKDFTINPRTKEKLMHDNPEHMKKIELLQKNRVLDKPKIEAGQNIMTQLQKAKTSMTGGTKIHFTHGDSKEVSGTHAAKLLNKHAGMKPDEKEAFQKKIGHSHANLKSEL